MVSNGDERVVLKLSVGVSRFRCSTIWLHSLGILRPRSRVAILRFKAAISREQLQEPGLITFYRQELERLGIPVPEVPRLG